MEASVAVEREARQFGRRPGGARNVAALERGAGAISPKRLIEQRPGKTRAPDFRQSTATSTSEDLITALAAAPILRPSSSTDSLVIEAVTRRPFTSMTT